MPFPAFPDRVPGFLGITLALAAILGLLPASGANREWFLAINHAVATVPEGVWQAITFSGDTLAALGLVSLLALRYPSLLWSGLLAALAGVLITHGIKPWLAMPRPAAVLPAELIHVIGKELRGSNSFPSGHTLTAFVLAGLWTAQLRTPALRILVVAGASLVGLSRIAVGAHWPIDVAGGALGGWLAAWLGLRLAARWDAGLSCRGHVVLLLFYLVCCTALPFHDGGYPQARWLAVTLGMLGAYACASRLWLRISGRQPPLPEFLLPAEAGLRRCLPLSSQWRRRTQKN